MDFAVKSETNKHKQRTTLTRTKLIKAAIGMIAARGLPGFALTNLGAEAGVSRGLASYHFADRSELIEIAFASLIEDEVPLEGLGLPQLLTWIGDQAQRAARREPELLALLQLAVGPGVEVEAPALRERYWKQRAQFLEHHLSAAQARGQIRDDLEAAHLATVLLGLLHGELFRIAATCESPTEAFTSLIERALGRERPATAKGASKPPPPSDKRSAQRSLFD